jgi:hypothetical protein
MCSNIVKAFEWLRDMLKEIAEPLNAVKSQLLRECLDCVNNIVLHHCAIHENCKPDICGFVELKEQHPDWTDEQLDAEYDKTSCFKGQ